MCRGLAVWRVPAAHRLGELARAAMRICLLARRAERLDDHDCTCTLEHHHEVVEERREAARRMRLEDDDRALPERVEARRDLARVVRVVVDHLDRSRGPEELEPPLDALERREPA